MKQIRISVEHSSGVPKEVLRALEDSLEDFYDYFGESLEFESLDIDWEITEVKHEPQG